MDAFWQFARKMGRYRTLLVIGFVFAAISAGGLGAGLIAVRPVLDAAGWDSVHRGAVLQGVRAAV